MSADIVSTAEAHLLESVFAPTFFQKLASYGIAPRSREEAVELLRVADKLRYQEEIGQAKQADHQASFISRASAHLDRQLGLSQTAYDAPAVKSAAAQFLTSQDVRDAALVYQAAFAQAAA